ncbi:MAG: DUF2599 domain-containing protein [Propionibacteriaceae bacterium]|jgi:hypothetical protein|nr:DUF2599 domain-containing protein [Propionibacteriaceae bacterium]
MIRKTFKTLSPVRIYLGVLVSVALMASGLLGTSVAHAETAPLDTQEVAETLTDITNISGSTADELAVLDNVADVPTDLTGDSAIDETINGVELTIPVDPSDPLTLGSATSPAVEIGLPYAANASDAEVVDNGVVVYDNQNGSATVPVVKNDGSVQITTIIAGPRSPNRYSYSLGLPAGGSLTVIDGGAVLAVDKAGKFILGIAPAWARDAAGRTVPTYYEVEGDIVTQVVSHSAVKGVEYPVVADPFLGIALFDKVTKKTVSGKGFRITAKLSWWGETMERAGYVTPVGIGGLAVMATTGWDEVKSKQPSVNKTTMYQQYICHVNFGWGLPLGDTWDFESWSGTHSLSWWHSHRCNDQ